MLTVGDSGAYLYASQDDRAERIGKLEKGEEVKALASSVGASAWFLVRTQKGVIGWVKLSDLSAGDRKESLFKEDVEPRRSTWSAVTGSGRTFGGTWSADANPATSASGTWSLRDATGNAVLHGTWSAEKFSTGWNGVWQAVVAGESTEYSGTWSAAFGLGDKNSLSDLLEAAFSSAVRGVWATENSSGIWSITAAK